MALYLSGINNPVVSRNRAAKRMAAAGIKGDDSVAHVQTGEIVVPKSLQTPGMISELSRESRKQGRDPNKFVVGSKRNQTNPITGAPMFADDADDFVFSPFRERTGEDELTEDERIARGIERLYFQPITTDEGIPVLDDDEDEVDPLDALRARLDALENPLLGRGRRATTLDMEMMGPRDDFFTPGMETIDAFYGSAMRGDIPNVDPATATDVWGQIESQRADREAAISAYYADPGIAGKIGTAVGLGPQGIQAAKNIGNALSFMSNPFTATARMLGGPIIAGMTAPHVSSFFQVGEQIPGMPGAYLGSRQGDIYDSMGQYLGNMQNPGMMFTGVELSDEERAAELAGKAKGLMGMIHSGVTKGLGFFGLAPELDMSIAGTRAAYALAQSKGIPIELAATQLGVDLGLNYGVGVGVPGFTWDETLSGQAVGATPGGFGGPWGMGDPSNPNHPAGVFAALGLDPQENYENLAAALSAAEAAEAEMSADLAAQMDAAGLTDPDVAGAVEGAGGTGSGDGQDYGDWSGSDDWGW